MWAPLICRSHGSILKAIPTPDQIVARAKALGFSSVALTDYSSLAAVPSFFKECKKEGIKGIAGCTVTVKGEGQLTVLARNKDGWRGLVRSLSEANRKFDGEPQLALEEWAGFAGGHWVVLSGAPGSSLFNSLYRDCPLAMSAPSYEEAKALVREDWEKGGRGELARLTTLFGPANVYVSLFMMDSENIPATEIGVKALRRIAGKEGIPCVGVADPHYLTSEDAGDHRVVLAIAMKRPLGEIHREIRAGREQRNLRFFQSQRYYLPTAQEMAERHAGHPEEVENTARVADLCEEYVLSSPPLIPKFFPLPEGVSAAEQVRQLCRAGWTKKVKGKIPTGAQPGYAERVKMELGVISPAGFDDYFLIIEDYSRWAKERGALVGPRGSGAGCLTAYLMDITGIDPIRFGLLFERFLNPARIGKAGACPDFDLDFPAGVRDSVVAYIRGKYGNAHVAQIASFGRMQGRSALKSVLWAHGRLPRGAELDALSAPIPDEAAIADQLEIMDEDERSIIRWALENRATSLKEYCFLKEDGTLDGEYAREFAQAIRLEGTWISRGKHASGVFIASVPLDHVAPLVYDPKSKELLVGVDYRDGEEMGLVKLDVLAALVQDRLKLVENLIRTGKLHPCTA